MLIAFETATDAGSVAIGRGPELIGEVMIGARSRHAESLLPALDHLRPAHREIVDLEAIAKGEPPLIARKKYDHSVLEELAISSDSLSVR